MKRRRQFHMFRSANGVLIGIGLFVFSCVSSKCFGQFTSLSNFNELSANVFNLWSETGESREFVAEIEQRCVEAQELAGDGVESAAFDACELLLMQEENIPFEVYRFAYLQRVLLNAVCSREDKALDILREWMSRYPDSADVLKVSCIMLQIVAWRRSDSFQPELSDVRLAAKAIFDSGQFDPQNIDVLDAYAVHAQALQRQFRLTGDVHLLDEALEQLTIGGFLFETLIQNGAPPEMIASDEYLLKNMARLNTMREGIQKRLSSMYHGSDDSQTQQLFDELLEGSE